MQTGPAGGRAAQRVSRSELPVGTLDVVIAGHSHRAMTGRVGEALFVETGSHGRALGAIDLVLRDGAVDASRSRVRPLWSLEHVSAEPWCVGEDEVPDGVIDVGGWPLAPHAEAADYTRAPGVWLGEGCTVVGCLDTAAWPERGGSPLGPLVADALLHSVPGADIAVQNSGGLRGALPAGEVRRRDVAGVMPFDNQALLVELSGRDLIAVAGGHERCPRCAAAGGPHVHDDGRAGGALCRWRRRARGLGARRLVWGVGRWGGGRAR